MRANFEGTPEVNFEGTPEVNFEGTPEVNESWIASEEKYEWRIGLKLDIGGEKCCEELSK